jgi:hypothetical protein
LARTLSHPRARIYGLLHDAHEAYLGDMIKPLKEALRGFDLYDARADLEAAIQASVHRKLGLDDPVPADIRSQIIAADAAMLAAEARDVMAPAERDWNLTGAPPAGLVIKPWPWPRAEEEFLKAFEVYSAEMNLPMHVRAA